MSEFSQSSASPTGVEQMATRCVTLMAPGSTAILDAYYASGKVLSACWAQGLPLIT